MDVIRKRFNSDAELISGVYAALVNYLKEKGSIQSGPFDAAPAKAVMDDIDDAKVAAFVARAKVVRNFPLSPAATVVEIPFNNFSSLTEKNPYGNAPPRSAAVAVYIRNCVFLI